MATGEDDDLLTIEADAEVLAVTEATHRRWDKAGKPRANVTR